MGRIFQIIAETHQHCSQLCPRRFALRRQHRCRCSGEQPFRVGPAHSILRPVADCLSIVKTAQVAARRGVHSLLRRKIAEQRRQLFARHRCVRRKCFCVRPTRDAFVRRPGHSLSVPVVYSHIGEHLRIHRRTACQPVQNAHDHPARRRKLRRECVLCRARHQPSRIDLGNCITVPVLRRYIHKRQHDWLFARCHKRHNDLYRSPRLRKLIRAVLERRHSERFAVRICDRHSLNHVARLRLRNDRHNLAIVRMRRRHHDRSVRCLRDLQRRCLWLRWRRWRILRPFQLRDHQRFFAHWLLRRCVQKQFPADSARIMCHPSFRVIRRRHSLVVHQRVTTGYDRYAFELLLTVCFCKIFSANNTVPIFYVSARFTISRYCVVMDQLVRAKRAVHLTACFTNRFLSARFRSAAVFFLLNDSAAIAFFPVTILVRSPGIRIIMRSKNRRQHQIFANRKAVRFFIGNRLLSIFPRHKMKSILRLSRQLNLFSWQIFPFAGHRSAIFRLSL